MIVPPVGLQRHHFVKYKIKERQNQTAVSKLDRECRLLARISGIWHSSNIDGLMDQRYLSHTRFCDSVGGLTGVCCDEIMVR